MFRVLTMRKPLIATIALSVALSPTVAYAFTTFSGNVSTTIAIEAKDANAIITSFERHGNDFTLSVKNDNPPQVALYNNSACTALIANTTKYMTNVGSNNYYAYWADVSGSDKYVKIGNFCTLSTH